MLGTRGSVLLLAWSLFSGAASFPARAQEPFQPVSTIHLGTSHAGAQLPFTQVITQREGERAITVLDELFLNLVPNWSRIANAFLTQRKPVVAYTTVAWGNEIVRITCWVDRRQSDLLRGHLFVVMEATEGTRGSIPVGTIFSTSDSRLVVQRGLVGLKTHTVWTPGLVPPVLPTPLTVVTQTVPGLWRAGRPGSVFTEFTFTSVEGADGSAPLTHQDAITIPVE